MSFNSTATAAGVKKTETFSKEESFITQSGVFMLLEEVKQKVHHRLHEEGILRKRVHIKAKVLSVKEAIGNPERDDFPLLKGRERIVEADFEGRLGHAFTDMYGGFSGQLAELFDMPLDNNYRRALLTAAINALSVHWGWVANTTHCKDHQPKYCARQSVDFIRERYQGCKKIAFIGYQPALLEEFVKEYSLRILDLDADNIGQERFSTVILDGQKHMKEAICWADLVLATGSTIVNGTIDQIIKCAGGTDKVVFYGVTIAGAAACLGLKRICFTQQS
jgi:hypothetical protein